MISSVSVVFNAIGTPLIPAKLLNNTAYGGINLEDISAPRCFEIEERLKKETNIPVFHDDQHISFFFQSFFNFKTTWCRNIL
jgi:malate dehydrogenase (oxaloacetate-decarboxylating)